MFEFDDRYDEVEKDDYILDLVCYTRFRSKPKFKSTDVKINVNDVWYENQHGIIAQWENLRLFIPHKIVQNYSVEKHYIVIKGNCHHIFQNIVDEAIEKLREFI